MQFGRRGEYALAIEAGVQARLVFAHPCRHYLGPSIQETLLVLGYQGEGRYLRFPSVGRA